MTDDPTLHPDAPVTHVRPSHYRQHPSGVEPLMIARLLPGDLFNVVKYLGRCEASGKRDQDIDKAVFYARDEAALIRRVGTASARSLAELASLIDRVLVHEDTLSYYAAALRMLRKGYALPEELESLADMIERTEKEVRA